MTSRASYDRELSKLKMELIRMCYAAHTMIATGLTALKNCDHDLAREVILCDKQVDNFEASIEKHCFGLLLKQQPVATDFREVSTALKMITDIERIADQASDISSLVLQMQKPPVSAALDDILTMGEEATRMVQGSVDAFVKGDLKVAIEIIKRDDIVDELFGKVKQDIVDMIRERSDTVDEGLMLLMVAKYLERIGDHSVNVCEWVNYFLTGKKYKTQESL